MGSMCVGIMVVLGLFRFRSGLLRRLNVHHVSSACIRPQVVISERSMYLYAGYSGLEGFAMERLYRLCVCTTIHWCSDTLGESAEVSNPRAR